MADAQTPTQVDLEFPFMVLEQYQVIFGGIPNYDEVMRAIPKEFHQTNRWSEAAQHMFSIALTDKDKEQLVSLLRTDSTEVAKAQLAYIQAWLGSFEPAHQDKIAVVGWLLSLMLKSPPKFGK